MPCDWRQYPVFRLSTVQSMPTPMIPYEFECFGSRGAEQEGQQHHDEMDRRRGVCFLSDEPVHRRVGREGDGTASTAPSGAVRQPPIPNLNPLFFGESRHNNLPDKRQRQGVAFTPRDHMQNSFGLLARCRLGAPSVASLHSYRVTKRNRLPCFCSLAHAGAWTRRRPRSDARAPLMTTVRFVK